MNESVAIQIKWNPIQDWSLSEENLKKRFGVFFYWYKNAVMDDRIQLQVQIDGDRTVVILSNSKTIIIKCELLTCTRNAELVSIAKVFWFMAIVLLTFSSVQYADRMRDCNRQQIVANKRLNELNFRCWKLESICITTFTPIPHRSSLASDLQVLRLW